MNKNSVLLILVIFLLFSCSSTPRLYEIENYSREFPIGVIDYASLLIYQKNGLVLRDDLKDKSLVYSPSEDIIMITRGSHHSMSEYLIAIQFNAPVPLGITEVSLKINNSSLTKLKTKLVQQDRSTFVYSAILEANIIKELKDMSSFSIMYKDRTINISEKGIEAIKLFLNEQTITTQADYRYFDYNNGFSICLPKNWINKDGYPKNQFFADSTIDGFTPNMGVNIIANNYNGSLENYIDLNISEAFNEIKLIDKNAVLNTKEIFITNNRLSGYKCSMVFSISGIKMNFVDYLFLINKNIYKISYVSSADSNIYYGNIVDESAKTFEIIK